MTLVPFQPQPNSVPPFQATVTRHADQGRRLG